MLTVFYTQIDGASFSGTIEIAMDLPVIDAVVLPIVGLIGIPGVVPENCLAPTCPNPNNDSTIAIYIANKSTYYTKLWIESSPENVPYYEVIFEGVLERGSHCRVWSVINEERRLTPGIYRIYLEMGDWFCYGDVEIIE